MTLDEVIVCEAEIAHERLTAYILRRTNDETYNTAEVNDLEKDGEYHEQLAKWLMDYKRLLEQTQPQDGDLKKTDTNFNNDTDKDAILNAESTSSTMA